jgi:glycosyltransferase involved in cell wall biosynthesis
VTVSQALPPSGSGVASDAGSPRFTVYIPSRNYGRFLSEAIESVLRQSVDDWELIVVDDGSDDETPAVMNLYQGHPAISLHRTESVGLPAVSNFALSRARGRYFIRLDGDDVFDENILLVLGNVLDRRPDVALVFPDYFLVDTFGQVFAHERRQRLYEANHMVDLPPNGACTLVRTAVLREVGGYREDLGAQDGLDLWTKVASRHKCANINLPLFYYRRHGTNLTSDITRIVSARRQIKKDAVQEQLAVLRPIIAVIPCRRNFDFLPNLWNQSLGDHTLLERDIAVCLSSSLFDHVVVTCDNEEAAQCVTRLREPRLRFVLRDTQSTIRSSSIVPTLERIARELDPALNGVTVLRYIQSPFVTAATLEEAVCTLAISDADSASAVEEIRSRVFRRSSHGLEPINGRGELRSDFDLLYRDSRTCIATRNRNLATGSLTGRSIASFIVSAAECFFIDSEHSILLARHMVNHVT